MLGEIAVAVRIHADWLQDGDSIEVTDFPQDVTLDPSHPYVSTSEGNVVIDQMFDRQMAVQDVHRYNIRAGVALRCPDVLPSVNCDLPTVVLLLESPHKKEYHRNAYDGNRTADAVPAGGCG